MGATGRIHADFIHLVAVYEMGNAMCFFGVIQGKISYNPAQKVLFRETLKMMRHKYSHMCQICDNSSH